MRLNEVVYPDAKPVDGYAPEGFRIGGIVLRGHVLCTPSGVKLWGGWDDIAALQPLRDEVDVIFIGTGQNLMHLPEDIARHLDSYGIPIEIMSTPIACRSYNVLLSEGRRIALAAITVG